MTAPSTNPSWSAEDLLAETGRVRALARHLVRAGEDADDLAQDALVAALEHPRRAGALGPWLAGVLRRRLAFGRRSEARRRARERAAGTQVAGGADVPPTDELAERAELCARVVRALTGLREPLRGALLLRYFADLTPAEIARRRGVPAATVRSQLFRGLAELRAELEAGFGGDRRRTDRALLGLALAPASTTTVPATPSLLRRLGAMNPAQVLVAGAAIVAAGGLLRAGLSTGGAAVSPSPEAAPPSAGLASAPTAAGRSAPLAAGLTGPPTAALQDEAVVRGRVLDREGTPLPAYRLELRHAASEEPELLWTDAAGRFQSAHAYPAGELSLTLVDHPQQELLMRHGRQLQRWQLGQANGRDWTPGADPVVVRAPAGPTFTLDLTGADGLDPTALTATIEALEEAPWGALGGAWWSRAPVRGGQPPWVRFPLLQGADERPWELRVESADGLLAGAARLLLGSDLIMMGPEAGGGPVALALEPSARLDVRLVVGPAVQTPSLALQALPSGARRPLLPVSTADLGDGSRELAFTRGGLPAGTYGLFVSLDDVDQLLETVILEAGVAMARDRDLTQAAASTRVAGELRSQSGTLREQVFVSLVDAAGETVHFAPARWEERDGQWVAPFAVDNVPPEGVELRLAVNDSHRRWSPLPLVVLPPEEGLVLVCQDSEPLHSVWLRILDAATGERLPSGWGHFELPGCEDAMLSVGVAGMSFAEGVPLGALVEWYAAADGFAPRWGGPEDLAAQEDGKYGVEVALEPGWGARIRTVRAGTLPPEPLPGVVVLLDGEPAGVTDDQGELVLARGTSPERVEAALAGWTYAGGDLDAARGRLASFRPWHVLRFAQ